MIMTIQSPNQEEFAEYVSKNGQVIIDFFYPCRNEPGSKTVGEEA